MRYRTQAVAYPYFVVAMLFYGLQMAFGLLAAVKYLGPGSDQGLAAVRRHQGDPHQPADRVGAHRLHGRGLLAGARRVAHRAAQPEARVLARSACGRSAGVTAVVGYLFRWTAGNKLLEQPLPVKLAIVVVMLMFLYNLGMTIWKAKRLTTTEGVLMAGLGA